MASVQSASAERVRWSVHLGLAGSFAGRPWSCPPNTSFQSTLLDVGRPPNPTSYRLGDDLVSHLSKVFCKAWPCECVYLLVCRKPQAISDMERCSVCGAVHRLLTWHIEQHVRCKHDASPTLVAGSPSSVKWSSSIWRERVGPLVTNIRRLPRDCRKLSASTAPGIMTPSMEMTPKETAWK